MNVSEELVKLGEGLQQQRDELVVQMNLAKLEIREEWDKVEEQLGQWQVKADSVLKEAKSTSEEVLAGLTLLADEINAAFQRIKSRI